MINTHVTDVAQLFSEHGLRCTRQRRALYDALAATKAHPTADQLYRDVIGRCPGMSLATVYNTLEAFCQAGLAQKLPGNDGSAHYDANIRSHLHMVVEKSGAVEDVPDSVSEAILQKIVPDLAQGLEQGMRFKVRHINVEVIGDYIGG